MDDDKTPIAHSEMRIAVDNFFQVQDNRTRAENRVRSHLQGKDSNVAKAVASDQLVQIMHLAEAVALRRMETVLESHPVMPWALGIPGINRATVGRLIGLIDDPLKFARFSNLRSFAGLCHLTNKRKKGEKNKYCHRMKTSLYIAFESMLKQHTLIDKGKTPPEQKYTDIYYNWRSIYKQRFGAGDVKKKEHGKDEAGESYTADDETARAWPDQRQHFGAKNKLLDVFLFHLYEEWLLHLGAPVPDLYVHTVLGHHMKYDRYKFSNVAFSVKKAKKHSTKKSLDRDIAEMKLEVLGPSDLVKVEV